MAIQRILTAQAKDGSSLPFVRPKEPLTGSPLSVVTTAAASVTVPNDVHMVAIAVTTDMHIAFGNTADTSDIFLKSGAGSEIRYFPVKPGDVVSLRAVTADGTAYISSVEEVGT